MARQFASADQGGGNKASTATSKPGGLSLTAPSETTRVSIASPLAMVDRRGAGGEDFDHDDQIDEKDRIAGRRWTANDRAIRSVDCPLVDQDSAAAAKDFAIATGVPAWREANLNATKASPFVLTWSARSGVIASERHHAAPSALPGPVDIAASLEPPAEGGTGASISPRPPSSMAFSSWSGSRTAPRP